MERRGGFTLIELCYVIAVIAILTSITVPSYGAIVKRARVQEAHATVTAIAHAELRHLRDRGSFVACGPSSEVVPVAPEPFPADDACWRALGIHPEGLVRYRYAVSLDGDGFLVTAEGDLDGDGTPSRFSLGTDLVLHIVDELE